MKKLILSLTLIGTMVMTEAAMCIAKLDSPNEKVQFKKASIEEGVDTSSTSVLLDDTVEPKCKCVDEQGPKDKERKDKNGNQENKKESSPRNADKVEGKKAKQD